MRAKVVSLHHISETKNIDWTIISRLPPPAGYRQGISRISKPYLQSAVDQTMPARLIPRLGGAEPRFPLRAASETENAPLQGHRQGSGPEPAHDVGREPTVTGDQGEILDPRLSYEHTIERITMMEREDPDLLHML